MTTPKYDVELKEAYLRYIRAEVTFTATNHELHDSLLAYRDLVVRKSEEAGAPESEAAANRKETLRRLLAPCDMDKCETCVGYRAELALLEGGRSRRLYYTNNDVHRVFTHASVEKALTDFRDAGLIVSWKRLRKDREGTRMSPLYEVELHGIGNLQLAGIWEAHALVCGLASARRALGEKEESS